MGVWLRIGTGGRGALRSTVGEGGSWEEGPWETSSESFEVSALEKSGVRSASSGAYEHA